MGDSTPKGKRLGEYVVFALFTALLASAEVVTAFANPVLGFVFHSLILVSTITLSALKYGENPTSSLFLSLSLAPLIRVVGLSLPLTYFPRYSWYILAGAVVFLSILTLMRITGMRFRDVGVTLNKPLTQLAIGATGIPLGAVEYFILRPQHIAPELSLWEHVLLAIAIIFFTGFVEELAFRGIIQRVAVISLGEVSGVLSTALIFAIMHIGWLSVLDFLFVFLIGILFGFVVLRVNSIIGVSLSHGVTNVVLFLVMPYLLPQTL